MVTTTVPTALRVIITAENMTTAQLETILDYKASNAAKANRLVDYIAGGMNRNYPQNLSLNMGAAYATGTFTITSTGPTNNETCTIAGVTFTAKTSGATGNQFNISSTPATVAANIAAAVNASSSVAGLVTATSAAGVVTFTSYVPGAVGNFITLSAGNLANTTASGSDLSGGAEGTTYSIDQK